MSMPLRGPRLSNQLGPDVKHQPFFFQLEFEKEIKAGCSQVLFS